MAMNVEQVLHMVGGAGETSYANNSRLQEKAILRTKPIVEESIEDIYNSLLPERMVVADLGCSSGPNTFLVMSEVIGAVGNGCLQTGCAPPEIQFFLNDLPGNDFNNVFRSLEEFDKKMKYDQREAQLAVPYYVGGVPGSFYGRLFPRGSVHFFHSSFCLMWLSQVPEGLGVRSNEKNIYISETSPPDVVKAYQQQHRRDFSLFLRSRYAELSDGGRMVLTFLGRKRNLPADGELSRLWELLAEALSDMASEGIIEEEELESLNLPFYAPSMKEVKEVIQNEGLFDVMHAQVLESNWDPLDDSDDDFVFDNLRSGKNVADCIRAVMEPILASHYGVGDAILDDLFSRYASVVSEHLLKEKTKYPIIVISLKRV